jgi:hypothetical protein
MEDKGNAEGKRDNILDGVEQPITTWRLECRPTRWARFCSKLEDLRELVEDALAFLWSLRPITYRRHAKIRDRAQRTLVTELDEARKVHREKLKVCNERWEAAFKEERGRAEKRVQAARKDSKETVEKAQLALEGAVEILARFEG